MPAEDDGLQLTLLGPVRARRGGTDLPLGPARRAAVLAMLALHAGHAVSRHELISAVWGDEPPASAVGNVYTYVSALRRALEPGRDRWAAGELLTSGGASYCLHVDEQDVDVFRFEALREQSRGLRAAGDRAGELAALEAALRLWQGDEPLEGVPGPYAEAQRVRLTELRLATAERHAGLLIEMGRTGDAAAALRALLTTYPARETLTALLATADGGDDRGPARIRVATGPATLIGRDCEIRQLRDAAAAVAAGRGRSIRVDGIAGLGKTALLSAALLSPARLDGRPADDQPADHRPAGARVGWGTGDELAQRMTLGVLIECAESAAVAGVEDLAAGPRTAEHAVALIRQAAAAGPLILVADDLQYADPVTLQTWAALHPVTRELPLLLVASARPGAVPGVPADDVIVLGPLNRYDATTVVRAVAGAAAEPPLLGRLLADAGGNPYYLRHLAASVRGGRWTTPPPELVAAVEVHLATLDEDTRHMLRAAAFLCDTGPFGCTVGEAAAVTGRRPEELHDLLRPARAAGVLADDEDTILFRHRIVARVLHESTPAGLRVMLHRSFAEELAEHLAEAGSAPERVVAQLLAGPVPLDTWAGRWLVRHVDELAAYAPGMTADLLRRVRTEPALDEDVRVLLSARLARLRYDRWENAVAEAGWVAARTTDPELEAEMRWIMASGHQRRGDLAAAAGVARSVLMTGRVSGPWQRRFRSLLTRADLENSGEISVIR
jgi:DNA-binding SARP family transcriptional activator